MGLASRSARRLLAASAVALLALIHPTPTLCAAPAAHSQAQQRVQATLVAGVDAVGPGAQFPVGVLLRIEPGWHVFWLNPGHAGLATSVKFIAPAGFQVGELKWPTPVEFKQADDARGYGYEREVLLAAPVQAPADLESAGTIRLRAEASWLACRLVCTPGRASLELTLPAGDRSGPANTDLFARWEQRLPLAEDAAGVPFAVQRTGRLGGDVELLLAWSGPAPRPVEWFPAADPMVDVGSETITSDARTTRIAVRTRIVTGQQPAGGRLLSLVAWTDATGQRRGVWLPLLVN